MAGATTAKQPSARVQRKRAAAADRIIEVALREFSSRGFERTSMNEIADLMNVTGASLYYYFPAKEDLLYACVKSVMVRLVELVSTAPDPGLPAADRLADLVRRHVRFDLENRQVVSFVNAYVYGPNYLVETVAGPNQADIRRLQRDVLDAYRRILEDGRAEGAFDLANTQLAAFNILALIQYPVLWYRSGAALTIEAIGDEQARAALRVVGWRGVG